MPLAQNSKAEQLNSVTLAFKKQLTVFSPQRPKQITNKCPRKSSRQVPEAPRKLPLQYRLFL
jgi:hypothetical protein